MPFKDKNKQREWRKQYYQKNKDNPEYKLKQKEYKKKNKDKIRAYEKRFRKKHRKNKYCEICKKEIKGLGRKYCKECSLIKKRENARVYGEKNGKNCISCGKGISRVSKICRSCSNKNKKGKYHQSKIAREKKEGKNNPMWKGDNVGFYSLHRWVERHKPKPKFCKKCNKSPPYDLANISGKYKRDINDFEWICRRCHMKSDGRLDRLHPKKFLK